MNISLIELLSIPPRTAGFVTAGTALLLIVLDVYAMDDGVKGNTPRQILVRWTAWARRFSGVPVTGAGIPFALGVLLGHWFHPESLPNLAGGFLGIGILVAVAVGLSVFAGICTAEPVEPSDPPNPQEPTNRLRWPAGRWSAGLTLAGILMGALFWPIMT